MSNEYAKDRINKRLQELDSERNELTTALRVLERLEGVKVKEEQVYQDVIIDFTGTKNLGQRLSRIAEAVSGPLDAKTMALCLIQRGQSKAVLRNLHAHVLNELRDNPAFEKEPDGSYKYLSAVTPGSSNQLRNQV